MSVQQILSTLDEFIQETREYRTENDDVLKAQNALLEEHGTQIRCLASSFKKHEPQLIKALNRRKWWGEFWDKTQMDLMGMGVKAGVVGLLALIWFAVSEKIIGAVIKATKSLTGG
jgi:hypothetical protein